MPASYFPRWNLRTDGGIIAPDERLPAGQTDGPRRPARLRDVRRDRAGAALMGFDPNVAIFFSGIGTLHLLRRRGRPGAELPRLELLVHRRRRSRRRAYARQRARTRTSPSRSAASSPPAWSTRSSALVVMVVGYAWIESADAAGRHRRHRHGHRPQSRADRGRLGRCSAAGAVRLSWMGLLTIAGRRPRRRLRAGPRAPAADPHRRHRRLRPLLRRSPTALGLGNADRLRGRRRRGLVRPARFTAPQCSTARDRADRADRDRPVAENLGHVKAVAAMTGREPRPVPRAARSWATASRPWSPGAGGGTGVTTYAENIGVMAVTKIYSSLVFVIAGVVAIVLGLLAQVRRADRDDSRTPVLGGLAIVLFGLIAATGARIWVQNKVDFSTRAQPRHRGRRADHRRRRPDADRRRLLARRHRHGDVRRDHRSTSCWRDNDGESQS